ncbi:hypothetical protein [Streptomyces antibioticus]
MPSRATTAPPPVETEAGVDAPGTAAVSPEARPGTCETRTQNTKATSLF